MGNKNNLPWLPNVPMPLNQTNEVGQARDFFIQLGIAPRPDSPTETWTVVGDDVDVLEVDPRSGFQKSLDAAAPAMSSTTGSLTW